MQPRTAWQRRLEEAWTRRSVVWLMGVRRVGKTVLSQSLPGIEYFDCELPRVRQQIEDPESFLARLEGRRIVLDEIHRLANPSQVLKIAADHHPRTKVLATGSSTLGASARFRDTLAGRKEEVWLTPLVRQDLDDFGSSDLDRRMLRGGLPRFFLSPELPERDFQEWMDAYWAKDILELFRLERRHSFLRFVELLLAQSGGIFEATSFAGPCEVSRTTITNYLAVLEATFVAHVLRPFSSRRQQEIVAAPKVYAFDSGFICYYRGWHSLRNEDRGSLWEHIVLNEMQAHLQSRRIQYWRTKQGREIDFVLAPRGRPPQAVECKWSVRSFDPESLLSFRKLYRGGRNLVVCGDVDRSFERRYDNVTVRFIGLDDLAGALGSMEKAVNPR
jgi:hypothetical protein